MLLDVACEVFDDPSKHQEPVFDLLKFAVHARHTWLPEPSVATAAIDYLKLNFPGKADWQTYLSNASAASAWQTRDHRPPVRVTADNATTVVGDLSLPAVIVVENVRNDGGFLKAVLIAYDPAMRTAIKEGWLHFDHSGGGGEQMNLADEAASRFNHICRVVVVKDNDTRIPFPRRSPESVEWEIPDKPIVHIWSRLEVENYLPDAALVRSLHPRAEDLLHHLREMSTTAQGWIDMKKGLNKTPPELIGSVDPEVRQLWRSGYGGYLPNPLVPAHLELTVDDFRCLGDEVHDELLYLLALIARVL